MNQTSLKDRMKPARALKEAGFKEGDLILSVNGIKLADFGNPLFAFQTMKVSKRSVVRVMREGKEEEFIYSPK